MNNTHKTIVNKLPHAKKLLLSFFSDTKREDMSDSLQITAGSLMKHSVSKDKIKPEEILLIKDIIKKSGLFDDEYYLKNNRDVAKSGMIAIDHYVLYGAFEGRRPSLKFDAEYYLATNHDVREMYANPLLHYIAVGKYQGRKIRRKTTRRRVLDGRQIDIINVNFYDWDGRVLFKGGAERYVYDLACLLKDIGYEPRILQNAVRPFKKTYKGIVVVGVQTKATTIRGMAKVYKKVCSSASLVIASPAELACELNGIKCIGINHGIYWDTINNNLATHRTYDYDDIFDAIRFTQKIICVDTNFINWARTYDYNFGNNLIYLPNYYNSNDFKPKKKDFNKTLIFCFPRRLYDARGVHITLNAFEYILEKYNNINLNLVGQTNNELIKQKIKKMIYKYNGKISLEEYPMEEMYKAYDKSHVVIIPTRYSEGTSLSCIEGMATNNATIVTNVGGLPNLVIDKYNGLVIEPNTQALINAVEYLVNNRSVTESIAKRGLEVSRVFEKTNWEKSWRGVIKEVMSES